MAFNYIQIIGDCFPASEAVILPGKNPTIYTDLTWISAPISQATLEASDCAVNSNNNSADSLNFVGGTPTTGDTVVWNGTEWVLQSAGSLGIFQVSFSNESTTKNRWLDYVKDRSCDEVPFVVPYNSKLIGITFSNKTSNRSTDVRIYKATQTQGNVDSLIHTWQVRNARTGRQTIFSPGLTFAAGDKVGIYLKDAGYDPKAPMVVLYFERTDAINDDFIENYSGHF